MVKPPPAEHAQRALTGRPLRAGGGTGVWPGSLTSQQLQRLDNLCSSSLLLFSFLANWNHEKLRSRS